MGSMRINAMGHDFGMVVIHLSIYTSIPILIRDCLEIFMLIRIYEPFISWDRIITV